MRGRIVVRVGLMMLAVVAARGQSAHTPLHPITTAPEGQKPNCSYGVTATDNSVSGTNTCPTPSESGSPVSGALPAGAGPQQPSAPAPSAAQKFPFPGQAEDTPVSAPAAAPAAQPADGSGLQDAGSSGTSSSSSSSSSSSPVDGEPQEPAVPGDVAPAPKRARKQLPQPAKLTPDEREVEDIKIAQFYMNDDNWRAAYMRGQDAVSITPDDWEAHFTVAVAARKLGKLDESVKEYRKTLELDPLPKQKKDAEKALKEMAGGGGDTLLP